MKIPFILRWAAWIAPVEDRSEWLAEWRGELAHVRRVCGPARATVFCLGAIPDALWLRRSHSPARFNLGLESPLRCLVILTILAAASVFLALRPSSRDAFLPPPYRDAAKLAMVSRHPGVTPSVAEIPVAEYMASNNRIPEAKEIAFYARTVTWVQSRPFVVAVASPNLFQLLGVPVSAPGLVISQTALQRYFHGDSHIVGLPVDISGTAAVVAAIIPDSAWRLPGWADAWLLDSNRLAALSPQAKGFMVARLRTPEARTNIRWLMSTPDERGRLDTLGTAPVPRLHFALGIFILFAGSCLILMSFGLGQYPVNRHSPSLAIRFRRWMFFAVKIALLLPIVFGGFFALGVLPLAPQAVLFCFAIALRWALYDQRGRCPVCLRSLSHPVRIGEASHTFLGWYGTELLCTRGHGLLHVPEIRTSCYAEQRWLYLDPSWSA